LHTPNGTEITVEKLLEKLEKHSLQYHNRYNPGWKVFEKNSPPHNRNVSWEAFVKYVAANNGDKMMNHHWRAQFHQCHICDLDYKYITHLENNSNEADFIFKKLKLVTGLITFQRLRTYDLTTWGSNF